MSEKKALEALSAAVAAGADSSARQRLTQFFDDGSFVEIDRLAMDGDRPADAVAGAGTVDGAPVYAYAQDRAVCCGAVGRVQAAKIAKVYKLAVQNGAPVVGFFDSDGAKLGEGIDAMDAIAEILMLANDLSGVVPQIAVLAGPCVGSSALIAATADVTIAAGDADYYLNVGDDKAKADITVSDADAAADKARELLGCLPSNNLTVPVAYDFDDVAGAACSGAADAIEAVADADSVVYLYNKDDSQTAFVRVGGISCGAVVLGGDRVSCCAAAHVARFVRLCDSFSLPVLTFVDAAAFGCLKGACKVSQAYAEATTVKLSVIAGRAFGAVYIAAAGKQTGADAVLAWPQAAISPLAPETAVNIFWADRLAKMTDPKADRAKLEAEYAETECSPLKAAAGGYVTDVVTAAETRGKLMALLDTLAGKRVTRLPKKHANIQL